MAWPARNPPGYNSFANARLHRPEAIVTLLHITSLIPAGKPGIIPGELPYFSELLPLPDWGVRQNSYNGARYGAGIIIDGGWGDGRFLRRRATVREGVKFLISLSACSDMLIFPDIFDTIF